MFKISKIFNSVFGNNSDNYSNPLEEIPRTEEEYKNAVNAFEQLTPQQQKFYLIVNKVLFSLSIAVLCIIILISLIVYVT